MSLNDKSVEELKSLAEALDTLAKHQKFHYVEALFTDKGVNSRDHYQKHMELMRASKTHRILAFVGGNGTGKSMWNCVSTYFHLSGKYPKWWDGHRFNQPIDAWMCAREAKNLREGIQEILFGGIGNDDIGTGIIPKEDLIDDNGKVQTWGMTGTPNCIGQFLCRHYTEGVFDGWSKVDFKTYAQGWKEFQGPTRQLITFDEEPDDEKIFAECVARLRPKNGRPPGHFLATFTPTDGFSNTYLVFVPNGVFPTNGEHLDDPQKYTVQVGWEDVPHLPEDWKKSAIAQWKISDPNNIEARTKGYAAMGSGRVYPVEESFIKVPRQPIPAFWPKCYGMDPGQANFACVWLARDPNTGVTYVYDEYKHGGVVYIIHAEAIKNRGQWIGGGIDPHEAVKPRDTGETIHSYFESSGLILTAAKGDPDALRIRIRSMLDSGALKIMDNCTEILKEIRTYRYDMKDPSKIARGQEDHRLDAMLYGICVFDSMAKSYCQFEEEAHQHINQEKDDSERNPYTGY